MKKMLYGIALFILCFLPTIAIAADDDGTYTNTVSGGAWSDISNWNYGLGPVANGTGKTADFSTINITASNTVRLDNGGITRTIGNLIFGDTTPSGHSWTISNNGSDLNTLTLSGSSPTITVNNLGAGTASLGVPVIGAGSVTKAGSGTLTFSKATDIAGDFILSAGTVNASSADFAVGGNCNLSGGTLNAGTDVSIAFILDGAGTQNLTSNGNSFYNLRYSGSGSCVLQDPLDVDLNLTNNGTGTFNCNNQTVVIKDFNSTSGTFIAPTSSTFSIAGGADINAGTFTAGTGTVTFNGSGDFATGNNTYNNIKITGALNLNPENLIIGGTLELSGAANLQTNALNVTVTGLTTMSAGTYTAGAGTHALNGGLSFSGGTINGTGTISGSAYSLTNAGTISAILGGAGVTLTKTGAGTATLSGANTYTGLTDVQVGTLKLDKAGGAIANTAPVKVSGGTLDVNQSDTVGAVELSSGTISGAGTLTGSSYSLTNTGTISAILAGVGSTLTKTGAGTATLSGNNTYTGLTDVQAGTLTLGRAGGAIADTAPVKVSGGTLDVANSDTVGAVELSSGTISGAGTLTGTSYDLTGSGTISSILAGAGIALTKTGAGTATLSGANTYTGLTDVQAGILAYGADNIIANAANVKVSGGTLNIGTYNDTVNNVQVTGGGISGTTGVLTAATDFDVQAGTISAILGGNVGLTKTTAGTVTLNGANAYTGTTTITTGTLQVGNASALGAGGAADVANNATLDIGSTNVNVGGDYTQGAGATLKVSVNGASSGSITAGGNATVNAGDPLVLNVSNYVPNGATYTIINGAGGAGVAAPAITVTGSTQATFAATTVGKDLILTASRTANGFATAPSSADSNGKAVGATLDMITNPSADMTTVLNAMAGLSNSQVAAALDTMVPEVDAGVINTSTATLNNFVGVAIDRVEKLLTFAKAGDTAVTGMSAGDESRLTGIWAKGYGSWLTQGTRNNIAGYDAWNAGTALGIDRLVGDHTITIGASGGYAYGNVDGDINNANTYINSAQVTLYGGYADANLPYFIDIAGSFAYNWYEGQRDIAVGPAISRTANASYEGQQYGAYLGGGYTFNVAKNIEFTPLVSLQWNHLHLGSYTETEAGALNLSVASQDYDQLLSGLGARIAAPAKFKWGTFTPEVHGKWFYDFIGDPFTVSSNFNGGGASFNSNGCKPALSSFNVGGQTIFEFKNDVSIIGNCDTELKDRFFGIYGSVTLRYEF